MSGNACNNLSLAQGSRGHTATAGERTRHGNHGNHQPRDQRFQSTRNRIHHSEKNQVGSGRRDKGRSRSSSFHRGDATSDTVKKISGPYTHLFCSERHAFAMSRVLYPQTHNQFLLPLNDKEVKSKMITNHARIATDEQLEEWWDSVKIIRCHVPFHDDSTSTATLASEGSNNNNNNIISFLERCPLCLDEEIISPCVAPCGHTFCLPCVLGYLNSVAKELNNELDRTNKSLHNGFGRKKSAVGASNSLNNGAVSNRASVTSIRARCPMCSSGSSFVLHAGDAIITYKDLRPIVFIPVMSISASDVIDSVEKKNRSVGGIDGSRRNNNRRSPSPLPRETRVKFAKLHRVKQCPAPYLPLTGHRVRGGTITIDSTIDGAQQQKRHLPDLPDGDDDGEECIYTRQYFVGINEYENILQRNLDDLVNYRERSTYCRMDPRELWNVAMAIEAIQAAQKRWFGDNTCQDDGFRKMEVEAKELAANINKYSEYLSRPQETANAKEDTALVAPHGRNKSISDSCLKQGTFHVHQNRGSQTIEGESCECSYYQSADGQHYYLSGFDMACLAHEFSLPRSTTNTSCNEANTSESTGVDYDDNNMVFAQRKESTGGAWRTCDTRPLPDEITAAIVAIEKCTVTTSLIKRKPFLSHVPLYSSVSFVEIDWCSGGEKGNQPLLSRGTLNKFRGEMQRRKSERLRAAKREKTAEEVARTKSEKDERRRRQELLKSNYFDGYGTRQTIDPGDNFFQASESSKDEITDKQSQWNRSLVQQFSENCKVEEMWPELK